MDNSKIDNHRYVVIKGFDTRNGRIAEGTEICMFRGIMYVNGVCVLPQYQSEIKDIILQAEEDKKVNRKNQYLAEYPWRPIAVY